MTATSALTSAPVNALRFWAVGRDIYVEVPSTNPSLPSTTLRFPYGPLGLSKALALLSLAPYDYGGEPMTGLPATVIPKSPILTEVMRRRGLIP